MTVAIFCCVTLGALAILALWRAMTLDRRCTQQAHARLRSESELERWRERAQRAEATTLFAQAQLDAWSERYERLYEQATGERRDLLDRIQAPGIQPGGGPVESVKMHHSEADEIEGVTPAHVAANVNLAARAERTLAHIDELARNEGVAPLPEFNGPVD